MFLWRFGPFRVTASSYGASQSHPLDTPHSVTLLWMSDQPKADTSTWQHTALTETNFQQTSMPPAGFEPTIPDSKQPQAYT
jgi:hypothetical protein